MSNQILNTFKHTLLKQPFFYKAFQNSVGRKKSIKIFTREYIRATANSKVLDVGCGPADILAYLPYSASYLGFDINSHYIDYARKKYGNRGRFVCADINNPPQHELIKKFDIILATGILHHLTDEEVRKMLNFAKKNLGINGRLVTIDGCYKDDQSKIAKFFLNQDRGEYVRFHERYVELAREVFDTVKFSVREDLLRIPYTHIIMECQMKN